VVIDEMHIVLVKGISLIHRAGDKNRSKKDSRKDVIKIDGYFSVYIRVNKLEHTCQVSVFVERETIALSDNNIIKVT
jgi:hypothetical protein